jgi:Flp pilus assembly protein TadD
LQRNDLKTAETHLGAAAKLEPGNGRVWIALAQTYRKLSEVAKADAAAVKAAGLGASDPLVQKSLAIYFSEAGELLQAAEAQTAQRL